MWLRLAGALAVTLIALGLLEALGASGLFGGRTPDGVHDAARGRSREMFWFLIFLVVMATSLLAALRRWAGHARRTARVSAAKRRPL